MIDPLTIHTHQGGTIMFARRVEKSAVPLWEIVVKGTVILNEESLWSLFKAITQELPVS